MEKVFSMQKLTATAVKQAKPSSKAYKISDGGRSRGSITTAGRARQIAANTKHGRETRAIREERSAKLAELYELEMLGRELGLISGGMVGRKPRIS